MDHAIQSPTVQKSLPDLSSLHNTLGFDGFLASPPPTITSDPKAVREHLRGYAVQLERHERFTEVWKHQYNNQLVNLRQLISAFDVRCDELRQLHASELSQSFQLNKQFLGLPEFEDLYYFLACKARTLYSDLQLRFGSNFLTMDDVLHYRGSSSYAQAACTVRDIRNFLRAVWFHLLHPVIIQTIETSMNERKYQALKARPLLPNWNEADMTTRERERMSQFQLGHNLDASMIESMFEHLEDVSTMSVPALLLKVSQRSLGIQYAPSTESMLLQDSPQNIRRTPEKAWIDLAGGEEQYVRTQIMQADMDHMPSYERELNQGTPSRKQTSKHQELVDQILAPFPSQAQLAHHFSDSPSAEVFSGMATMNNVRTWLPNVVTSDRSPLSSIADMPQPSTPKSSSRKSGFSLPSTPSHYRMPFHGFNEFPHEPPAPPPKSPADIARAQEADATRKAMKRDSSRLQDALQQVEVLQRENSQLHERLKASPGGLFRRLSKGGSPRKSPRRSILHGVKR